MIEPSGRLPATPGMNDGTRAASVAEFDRRATATGQQGQGDGRVRLAQAAPVTATPNPIGLSLAIPGMKELITPGTEQNRTATAPLRALANGFVSSEVVGARTSYLGDQMRNGNVGTVLGHLLLGRPFPDSVDNAMASPKTAPVPAATVPAVRDQAGQKVSPAAQTLVPPGDCGQQRQQKLQSDVERACKDGGPRKCKGGMSLSDLTTNMERNRECGVARDRINKECFKGGNVTHRNSALDAWKSVTTCEELISKLP